MKIKFPKIFHSKLFLAAMLILLAAVFGLELKQWRERQVINREIEHLVAEQQDLEQKNLDLEQSLQYFSSDPYREKLAREQLGLRKDGEIVVNFPRLPENSPVDNNQQLAPGNPQKWWEYFFLKN